MKREKTLLGGGERSLRSASQVQPKQVNAPLPRECGTRYSELSVLDTNLCPITTSSPIEIEGGLRTKITRRKRMGRDDDNGGGESGAISNESRIHTNTV